jgi:hypothetical protein
MSLIQSKSAEIKSPKFISRDIQLDSFSPESGSPDGGSSELTSAIEAVESRQQRVKLFRGSKVVAEIVPSEIVVLEEVAELLSNQSNQYRTWGESLS